HLHSLSTLRSPSYESLSLMHPATTALYPLSLHDALPILYQPQYGVPQQSMHYAMPQIQAAAMAATAAASGSNYPYMSSDPNLPRSEEHTSELQSRFDLVCRLLLEKKNITLLTKVNSHRTL